jgi:predicted MFS family arabinose efflux permease
MRNKTKGRILKGCALAIDVGAPLTATLTQFPLWIEKSADATMSGLCLVFALLSCLPFLKQIKEYFKNPSSWMVFTILFFLFVMLRNIIDQMLVVSFVGMVANILGAGLYVLGNHIGEREEKKKENEREDD